MTETKSPCINREFHQALITLETVKDSFFEDQITWQEAVKAIRAVLISKSKKYPGLVTGVISDLSNNPPDHFEHNLRYIAFKFSKLRSNKQISHEFLLVKHEQGVKIYIAPNGSCIRKELDLNTPYDFKLEKCCE